MLCLLPVSSPAAAVLVFSVRLERADWRGRQPQVSLLSLGSLPPEPERASATNNVLYRGALITQLTTFTQAILTVPKDELNHVLFLKLILL